MILDRKHFDINNKCAIEKLIIKPPFRIGSVFQDEACFIYLKEGEVSYTSPTSNISIQTEESLLLRCGYYFANAIRKLPAKTCEIFAVHLYPDILKELYKNEFPNFLKEYAIKPYIRKVKKQSVITHFIQSLNFYFENPNLVTDDLLKLKFKELILLLLQIDNAAVRQEQMERLQELRGKLRDPVTIPYQTASAVTRPESESGADAFQAAPEIG